MGFYGDRPILKGIIDVLIVWHHSVHHWAKDFEKRYPQFPESFSSKPELFQCDTFYKQDWKQEVFAMIG